MVDLPKHPVPMRTMFRRCLLVNFAVDVDAMRSVLPPHVEPDVYGGHAYLSVVVAEMEKMRPAFLPRALGITYNQVVYRVVVRCGDERGVHFLRSDADSRVMSELGNALSFFRFHHSAIEFREHDGKLELDVTTASEVPAGIHATYTVADARDALPPTSAFPDLATAKAWLVELFAAFAYTPGRRHIDVVRIDRGAWDVQVVDALRGDYEFMTSGTPFGPGTAGLDSIFLVGDVPYHWHRNQRIAIP
jgi:uncharacterized protein YqjF (DUF2071 family)